MKLTNFFKSLFVLAVLLLCGIKTAAQEPYAVLSEDKTTLTFYYDDQKGVRSGMDIGPFEYKYPSVNSGWYENRKTIRTVVFDDSFASCMSITSTAFWFFGCSSLTNIIGIGNLKTDNVTDMSYLFSDCYKLTRLDLSGLKTDNVTNMSGMFSFCESLTSLDVSGFKTDNVTNMSNMFCYCFGLTSLDVIGFKTDNVTDMSWMFSGCSTSIDVSRFNTENVTNMSHMFYECRSGLTSLDLSGFKTDNVTDMSFMFYNCSSLKTIYASALWSTANVRIGSDMFAYCENLVGGHGTTYDRSHINYEYARIDGGAAAPGYFTEFGTAGTNLYLLVTDTNGNVVTSQVSITWYDAYGKELGKGSQLGGIEDGTEVYYSIVLDEDLGRQYREVNMQKVVAEDGKTVTCQLERIGRVTLEGRVSATDIDKNTATIAVRQMLNGKWEENFATQTNEQGLFSVEVYDDMTDIIVSCDGCFDTNLHRDGFGGSGNVGIIPLSLLTGFAIAPNITLLPAVAVGETAEPTAWVDGLNNIAFTLENTTTGKPLEDVTVQNGNVIIKSGASVGDNIKLTAVSKQGVFADATTTFTIAEGANTFDLQLTELGGIDATCTVSSNGATVGYLYDSNGVLQARSNYVGETLSLRHFPSGIYTLVSMGSSLLLGSLTHLSDLTAIGLAEGVDYVSTPVAVTDGLLTAVGVSDVPSLDDSQFYYTNGNTYFQANMTSLIAGNYLTLSARTAFKAEYADKVDGVTLTIDLPEGCELVENSVIANLQAVAHALDGKRLTMQLTKEQFDSPVRFCVIPTLNKTYTLTAIASFDCGGLVQQPIGTAVFEAKGLSLSAPKITGGTNVTISGTAKGHSEVSIYDNDVLIGKTESKADGTWTTACELYKPYSPSFHDIYAKITTEKGMELTSETKQVEYDKNKPMPRSVMMTFYNGWYKKNIDVEFNLLDGSTTPSSYPYYSATDFTFLADFTRNDPDVIKNVNIKVLNSDGTVRTLPATFNSQQEKWVATTRYSSSYRLPQNATVEFEYIPELTDNDREESMLDQGTNLAACANHIYQVLQEKASFIVVSDDEQSAAFEMKIDGVDEPFAYRIENMDYAVAEKLMEEFQFIYASDENGSTGTYFEQIENGISVVAVDLSNNYAFRITLTSASQNVPKRKRRAIDLKASISTLKTSLKNGSFIEGFGETAGIISKILGLTEYLSVKSDFENMCDLILHYNNLYLDLRQQAVDALLAKCSDGSYKVSKEKRDQWWKAINALSDSESAFTDKYYHYLEEYKNKLRASVGTFIASMGLGKAFSVLGKGTKFISSKANQWLLKQMSANTTAETSASILSNALGTITDNIFNGIDNIFDFTNFDKVKDTALEYANASHSAFLQDHAKIKKGILEAYKTCEKQPDDNGSEEKFDDYSDENKPYFPSKGTQVILDPSGYVYEAVLSNRLSGVTVTCYQQEGGQAVQWNAEDYSQQNPLVTDDYGFYRWDVPMGNWQVKYEKEGYETAYSEWLPVPPPQLDVNVGMKQSTPPAVEKMRGYTGGITIDMSKYMLPATLNKNTITVTRNGMATNGTIEALDLEKAPTDETEFVSKVKFLPEMAFSTSDEVVVTVHKEVESYCGVQMTADHVETVKIETDIEDLLADSVVTVSYQDAKEIQIVALPKQAVAGKKLQVLSSSPMIASLDVQEATFDDNGTTAFTVSGNLPGSAYLTFSIENTDLSAQTRVKVVMDNDLVATPQASIKSGETVEAGTQLVLTCATEGATIYYTLDGSCPCDEATRIKYESPIVITAGVIVKAIAIKDGMTDSDVATFVYVLDENTDIRGIDTGKAVDIYYENGILMVEGAEGGSCHVYDYEGRELAARSQLGKRTAVRVPKAKGYIVSVQVGNANALVRKLLIK